MNIFFVVIAIAIVVCLLIVLKSKQTKSYDGLGFISRDVLFTPAERSFLGVLEQALDSRYRVFGKVRLGDLIKPAKGLTASKRTTALNKINQKHVDFVVCAASDLSIVAVIELDDQSHEREDRAERDGFVDHALAMAQIPVVHFPAKKGYVVQEIKAGLTEVLPATATELSSPELQESIIPPPANTIPITGSIPVQSESALPICPKCAAVMVKRQAAKGVHAGKWFWACSAFPKCRQVVAIEGS
jgi:very-short-patch-repair endonuclease